MSERVSEEHGIVTEETLTGLLESAAGQGWVLLEGEEMEALAASLRSARARVAALEGEVERLRGDRKKTKSGLPRCPDCGIPAPEGAHVLIIVNGEDVAAPVAVGESLSHARARALQQTKNTGRPPEEWEIRSAKGRLLEPWALLNPEHYKGRHVWIDGDGRLFLTLRIGFGG
jgi:hypothetical protein